MVICKSVTINSRLETEVTTAQFICNIKCKHSKKDPQDMISYFNVHFKKNHADLITKMVKNLTLTYPRSPE